MATLVDSEVHRRGLTARHAILETKEISPILDGRFVSLDFRMKSKGGGKTEVNVRLGAGDFGTLIRAMIRADRQASLKVMALELSRAIDTLPSRESDVQREAWDAVTNLAETKYDTAPAGADEVELLVYKRVEGLVRELKDGASSGSAS